MKCGLVFGHPGDAEQQRRVVTTTLSLLETGAPLQPLVLDEA